ncbi:Glycosyltransferase involved in cell wall bisynthesis [Mariprofundus ferrinatatus]|uniref:Glycosyltransferase involved in cell wall bisynthesis n=1 Tax=Mariprofundus ferrinatatus TaxID=1921087 RepID=A0A2K8L3Z9_9PROT|nr:glycosyltransferase family 2 protein [Mariprofundus ferrinatatus]ATX82050.1 Glycosyltransferase involved in cell wall bisynthesis [Mariprofundus ferrinatatus]
MNQTGKLPITVTIIACNEEKRIGECLSSVQWSDDIVVVDSGSSDRTVEIAESHGARVIHNPWPGYGEQKQFASSQAKNEWILNLDADEYITPELAESIRSAFSTTSPESPVAFECNFEHFLMGKWLRHGEAFPDPHIRLFNRQHGDWNSRPIHEHIEISGEIGKLEGTIRHRTVESLAEYIDKINRYTDLQAEIVLQSGVRVTFPQLFTRSLWRFLRGYILRLGFLDGVAGLTHSMTSTLTSYLKYAKAYELQNREKE